MVVLVLTAGTSRAQPAPGAKEAPRKRNVLFIVADDLNHWIGALGAHPDSRTPGIDRLASRGVLFTRAYCVAPACNPSRTGVLCGLRPSTSGVYHNDDPWRAALPNAVPLSQHFMANGYHVAAGGKIFHGGTGDPAFWHETFRPRAAATAPRAKDTAPRAKAKREAPAEQVSGQGLFQWGPTDAADEDMGDAKLVDWAAEFLGRKHEKPFFLAVGLARPHLPWHVPRKYFADFPPEKITLPAVKEDDLDDVPALGKRMANPEGDHKWVVESGKWREAVSAYLASIRFADAMVGRLLDALERSAYAKETFVVFWGDNGFHLGEKLHWRKFALWEEATRVPLIVAAPGVTPAGARSSRAVSLLDLYPTLIDLCGLEPREGLEGRSLRPLLEDPAAPWERPAVMTHGRGNHSVRTERWRYIRYSDGTEELYDHDKDPREWTNVAGLPENAEVKKDLGRWLPTADKEERQAPPKKARRQAQKAPTGPTIEEREAPD